MNRVKLLETLGQHLPRVVALIGAGGKTTLLHAWGDMLARQGKRVVLTTTTHLGWEPGTCSPASPEELNAEYILPAAFDKRVGPAVAKAVAEAAKKSGVARI